MFACNVADCWADGKSFCRRLVSDKPDGLVFTERKTCRSRGTPSPRPLQPGAESALAGASAQYTAPRPSAGGGPAGVRAARRQNSHCDRRRYRAQLEVCVVGFWVRSASAAVVEWISELARGISFASVGIRLVLYCPELTSLLPVSELFISCPVHPRTVVHSCYLLLPLVASGGGT